MARWRGEYQDLKQQRWGGYGGYDSAVTRANNASFGVQAAYYELVPGLSACSNVRDETSRAFMARSIAWPHCRRPSAGPPLNANP